jgi:hypothetical protein
MKIHSHLAHWIAILFGSLALLVFAIPFPSSPHVHRSMRRGLIRLQKSTDLKDPCEKQANNLIANGAMSPDRHDTPFGTVAMDGLPLFGGSPPQFRVVDNEGVRCSQQIYVGLLARACHRLLRITPGVSTVAGDSLAAKAAAVGVPNMRVGFDW